MTRVRGTIATFGAALLVLALLAVAGCSSGDGGASKAERALDGRLERFDGLAGMLRVRQAALKTGAVTSAHIEGRTTLANYNFVVTEWLATSARASRRAVVRYLPAPGNKLQPVRVINDQGKVYVTGGQWVVGVPAERPWILLDGGTIANQQVEGKPGFGVDPLAFTTLLAAISEDVSGVEEEQVDGVKTTHVSGTVNVDGTAKQLTPEVRAEIERLLDTLEIAPKARTAINADVWVDGSALVRRFTLKVPVPGESIPIGQLILDIRLSAFGEPVKVDPPRPDQVTFVLDTPWKGQGA